jgi:NADPH:quinone reductase-like Zn-dependent oxidoreductase
LERGGRVVVYGALSEQGCLVHPGDFIFRDKRLEGFWLPVWMQRQNMASLLWAAYQVQKGLGQELATEIQGRYRLADGIEGVRRYIANMTQGKILMEMAA